MINVLLGKKIAQLQKFRQDGSRIPVTVLDTSGNVVCDLKTVDKNGYVAVQLGFGKTKKEVRLKDNEESLQKGQKLLASEVFSIGNVVAASGVSKGKGFAGVVKRHHFKGGPRTHGQSDRERAPGSIGQTTTPGRVYKGKRMAGRMGHVKSTVKNLRVVGLDGDKVIVSGLLPGGVNSIIILEKTGEDKKYTPIFEKQEEKTKEESAFVPQSGA